MKTEKISKGAFVASIRSGLIALETSPTPEQRLSVLKKLKKIIDAAIQEFERGQGGALLNASSKVLADKFPDLNAAFAFDQIDKAPEEKAR